MIIRKSISDELARQAIQNKEFPQEIIASDKFVAIALTQHWCHQWVSMQRWLDNAANEASLLDINITVWHYVYDQTSLTEQFQTFKENVFKNELIPYIRYYVDGVYIGDSNYLPARGFARKFTHRDG